LKVLIGPSTFAELDTKPLAHLQAAGCEVIKNPYKRKLTKSELMNFLKYDVTGLIAGLEPLDREVLRRSKLRVISRCGAGLSNIDLRAAKELGIKVRYTPDGPTTAVAELTLGALLSMLRMIYQMDRDLHNGKWTKKIGLQLEGKTVAIIGFGRIGRKVASLLEAFNIRIIAVDPNLHEEIEGMEVLPLNKALGQADIITIHSSGEQQIIGENEFKLIKQGTFLLNAARGELVDEQSLIRALEEGKIRGAWLDTFKVEPYRGSLTKYPQVILTPHIGSYALECRRSMEMEAAKNLICAFEENK